MRTLAAVTVLLALCGIAAAQTTTSYTIPVGTMCTGNIEGCYYHNLTATAPDGSTLWGIFDADDGKPSASSSAFVRP